MNVKVNSRIGGEDLISHWLTEGNMAQQTRNIQL